MSKFCSHCGTALTVEGAKFCAECGQPQGASGPIAAAAPARAPEKPRPQEETLLTDPVATVTTTRFLVPGQTYAISGITSVSNVVDRKAWPVLFVLAGLAFMLIGCNTTDSGAGAIGAGLLCLFIGGMGIAFLWTERHIVLRTAGGEVRALSTRNSELADAILIALDQAIIRRG